MFIMKFFGFSKDNKEMSEKANKKELNEADLYMQINVLLEKDLFDNYGQADLFDPVEATWYY